MDRTVVMGTIKEGGSLLQEIFRVHAVEKKEVDVDAVKTIKGAEQGGNASAAGSDHGTAPAPRP